MEISIRKIDLEKRWYRRDRATSGDVLNYIDDNGFLRGGEVLSENETEIVYAA